MTSFVMNITFDAADPRTLAAFWAAATGYEVAAVGDDFADLQAPDKRGVRHFLFFKVPEPKAAKNRVHVDLATREPEAEIARLIELGAALVDETEAAGDNGLPWREGNGARWVVMRDPEGNEFCIG